MVVDFLLPGGGRVSNYWAQFFKSLRNLDFYQAEFLQKDRDVIAWPVIGKDFAVPIQDMAPHARHPDPPHALPVQRDLILGGAGDLDLVEGDDQHPERKKHQRQQYARSIDIRGYLFTAGSNHDIAPP